MKKPNLFVVGAPKSGTSSLVSWLSKHRDVYVPAVKEPHYLFSGTDTEWYYYKQRMVLDDEKFSYLYRNAKSERYLIDGSVHYLRFSSLIAPKMKAYSPDAKVIVMIREPVSRINSHYFMDVRSGLVSEPLEVLLSRDDKYSREYLESSRYFCNIKNYIDEFGQDQVLVVNFADYTKRSDKVFARVLEFLSLRPACVVAENKNEYRMPRPWAKYIYRSPLARRLYRCVVPHGLREFVKPIVLNTKKPDVAAIKGREIESLSADYQKSVKIFARM